ncbi:MAG: fdh3 [Pseudonocardia sp.]|jgi:threonine dehydrogenase-like Zn-dependent dehydrogenase|nr:fdh3 [Pseudonocardia sp.]MDT7703565.1 hypothetical protein [Pseudonocardiales bacterium]
MPLSRNRGAALRGRPPGRTESPRRHKCGTAFGRYFPRLVQSLPPATGRVDRSLTLRTGRCHVQRYMTPLLRRIELGELDPTRITTHRLPLDEAPRGYDIFKNKEEDCEKVVLTP